MRGVSAGSRDALLSAVDEQVRGDADAAALGGDLFAVVGVLDSAPSLCRMLTNPSSTPQAKRGLVQALFANRVAAPAQRALSVAVEGRWNSGTDLPDAVEDAGVEAYLAAADAAGELEEVEDELFRFGRVVHGDPALRSALSDRTTPLAGRRSLAADLLEGKARPATVALVTQAVAARRRAFEATLGDFVAIAAQRRDQLVATVRSAYALSEDERSRLAGALGAMYDRTVHVNVVVEPGLLGGVTVEIGDEVIDSSVSGRLERARRSMTG